MESPKRKFECTTEEYSTAACKIPKWDAPASLPEGAWAQWGKDAVCFVLPIGGDEGGFGVFAINPADSSVYHIADFPYGSVNNASCAILGSRVYVVSDTGSMWFCDIGGSLVFEWKRGKYLNGSRKGIHKLFTSPKLFTLEGNLYAVDWLLTYPLKRHRHNFQMLFKNGWLSLRTPPTLCPSLPDYLLGHDTLGVVCHKNKVYFHVGLANQNPPFPGHRVAVPSDKFYEHRLLCYERSDDFDGKWTVLGINSSEVLFRVQYIYDPSVLQGGGPLFLMPSGKIYSFGRGRYYPFELVEIDLHELDLKPPIKICSLLHVGGSRYCAIAFTEPDTTCPKEPADFVVLSFDRIDREEDVSFDCIIEEEEEESNMEDSHFGSSRKIDVSTRFISRTHERFSDFRLPPLRACDNFHKITQALLNQTCKSFTLLHPKRSSYLLNSSIATTNTSPFSGSLLQG